MAFLRDRRGASAVEFSLVLPVLVFLMFGIVNFSMMLYASSSLHSAVQQAARYAATQYNATGTDPGSTAVTAYASARYLGPGIGANYSYATNGTCGTAANGRLVSATGTFKVAYGAGVVTFPLSATACFPS